MDYRDHRDPQDALDNQVNQDQLVSLVPLVCLVLLDWLDEQEEQVRQVSQVVSDSKASLVNVDQLVYQVLQERLDFQDNRCKVRQVYQEVLVAMVQLDYVDDRVQMDGQVFLAVKEILELREPLDSQDLLVLVFLVQLDKLVPKDVLDFRGQLVCPDNKERLDLQDNLASLGFRVRLVQQGLMEDVRQ